MPCFKEINSSHKATVLHVSLLSSLVAASLFSLILEQTSTIVHAEQELGGHPWHTSLGPAEQVLS